MKLTRKDKEERAKRFNISIATYYNWEKEKPELIKILELGLQKEQELENDDKKINNEELKSEITNVINSNFEELFLKVTKRIEERDNKLNDFKNYVEEKKEELNKIFEKVKNDR